jgi:alanyl-tRNA synthetase
MGEGAMALFGEKYGETVRTIAIGENDPFSYELCGGTHVEETGDIGVFLITSEGSAAAGIRRIEAVTGRGAYELIQRRFRVLKTAASLLAAPADDVPVKIQGLLDDLETARKSLAAQRRTQAAGEFTHRLEDVPAVKGVPVLAAQVNGADADTLRELTDRFRQRYPSGVAVLASVQDGRPVLIAAVTEDLVKRGLAAGELVKFVAAPLGGGGGGKPTLAQAGGKDVSKLAEALASVAQWVENKL